MPCAKVAVLAGARYRRHEKHKQAPVAIHGANAFPGLDCPNALAMAFDAAHRLLLEESMGAIRAGARIVRIGTAIVELAPQRQALGGFDFKFTETLALALAGGKQIGHWGLAKNEGPGHCPGPLSSIGGKMRD